MTDSIYLEVDKDNGAIMSYYLQPPAQSPKYDYIEATQAELTYLSALEDLIFAPGTVASLSDLVAHRERVAAIKKSEATSAATISKRPQMPPDATSKPSSTKPSTTKENAKASLISALKQHRSTK